jgi:glutamate dehydrogenase (NAD(P)+)
VSYFERTRNLSHMRFGRMQRQYDEMRGRCMLSALESLSERNVDEAVRKRLVSGASELDLVRSGLDDTMRIAFQNLREVMKRNPAITDYRTTAYALALEKIVQNYPRNRSWTGWCVRFLGCRARHNDAD